MICWELLPSTPQPLSAEAHLCALLNRAMELCSHPLHTDSSTSFAITCVRVELATVLVCASNICKLMRGLAHRRVLVNYHGKYKGNRKFTFTNHPKDRALSEKFFSPYKARGNMHFSAPVRHRLMQCASFCTVSELTLISVAFTLSHGISLWALWVRSLRICHKIMQICRRVLNTALA
jgi:hypothetical protein